MTKYRAVAEGARVRLLPAEPSGWGHALALGTLAAAFVVLLDFQIMGGWMGWQGAALVWTGCVLGAFAWGRRGPAEADPVRSIEGPQRDRLVMLNPPTPEQATAREHDARQSDFDVFVRTCQRTTALRDHERLGTSRAQYNEYRETLIRLGWGAWRSKDRRQGWTLTAPAADILDALE